MKRATCRTHLLFIATRFFWATLCSFALTACSSYGGMQEPLSSSDKYQSICPSQADISRFEAATPETRGTIRDDVLSECIDRVDQKYQQFKVQLQKEFVGTNLTIDLLSLGLASGATLASGSTAKNLSAGAATVIGAGTAINKDVFFQQTLPAIESSMDANRDKVHTLIIDAESRDSKAVSYTLSRARSDIEAYQDAGNIYTAISKLTAGANQDASDAKTALQNAKVDYAAIIVQSDVAKRLQALSDYLNSLSDPGDASKLDAIVTALVGAKLMDAPASGASFQEKLDDATFAAVHSINDASVTDQKVAMDKLSSLISPISQRVF